LAIRVNDQAGLAEFAYDRELLEAVGVSEKVADLDGLLFENIKIRSKDFDGKSGFQTGERFIHGIFGGLRVIEYDTGIGFELALDVLFQFGFIADRSLTPGFVAVGLESDVELTVEKSRRVGAIVRTAKLGADNGDHRISVEYAADLRRKLRRILKSDRIRHGGANPESAFIEMRQKFAADVGNQQQRRTEDE